MKKKCLPLMVLPLFLALVSFMPLAGPHRNHSGEKGMAAYAGMPFYGMITNPWKFTSITINPAPAPPAPYQNSVYFKYGSISGNYFKVESVDGCPFYVVNAGAPVTYVPVTGAENIFGIFFKSESGCGSTRLLRVSYNDSGSWTPFENFVINL
ncbi:hypothetical protein LL912_20515 [Niabella sp. CC-SYL272]|uniref:hypothetical protein n=1 Tax=Niabella agricola TaxID=2891571 RepID=UPI001F3459F1|nr:hypothetical protein [Niabella agricola]MCF3111184.1 hypothetical protein [Niabella agricola]